ncbi:Demethylspheroidene O-methyltransferase [Rubripirellula lacrimiformis]|uniref:Demethylspheroidene O-methyltransferase n=1 Tax=Rubripirellula lacrimiformis TaxID=1930273 RepID=A0A517N701_9BACT|nr:methyltransferase [Rubripirellula lacrimiformis]QDT02905.1 Demethylspheroidene O-methyltransferase [Rubripirellula lacrimiformis]
MPHPLSQAPTTAPTLLLRYRDRQYAADLIAAAVLELDLFTWLDQNGPASTDQILDQFSIFDRPTDVMLTLCRSMELIATDDQGLHCLTTTGREHLVSSSPWFLGPYYQPLAKSSIMKDHLKVLRSGKPGNWQANDDGSDWHASMLDPEFARGFTDMMNCRGLSFGQALAKSLTSELADRHHVLDVGGGSGIYSTTIAAAHDHLKATVFEQPPVDKIVTEEIARHGLQDRVDVVSGDMFNDAWPQAPDVVLLSNVLHDWDFPEVEMLLRKTADALPSGGLVVIHEAFIRDDKTGPLPVAEYSALLANITQGKCYSAKEYGDLMAPMGFTVGDYHDTIADRGYMTAIKN